MQILIFKLLLTPILTGAATWAGRKYGHNVSGLLIGLPLNAGPIALFLALQHGNVFAANSAKGIILGAVSLALYATTYALLCRKFHFLACAISGWVVYLGATFLFNLINVSLIPIFLITLLALYILFYIFPKYKEQNISIVPPLWDIPIRIILATLFIIALTYVSGKLGPNLSGLLSTFPIFGTIFAITTHFLYGSEACIRLLKGVIVSLFSFSVFFLIIALTIIPLKVLLSFTLASMVCLVIQSIILYTGSKLNKS